jgi:hypothetical protein
MKKTPSKKQKTKLSVELSAEDLEALKLKATKEHISLAALIRRFAAGLVGSALLLACGGDDFSAPPNKSAAGMAGMASTAGKSGAGGGGGDLAGASGGRDSAAGTSSEGGGGDAEEAGAAPGLAGAGGDPGVATGGSGGTAGLPEESAGANAGGEMNTAAGAGGSSGGTPQDGGRGGLGGNASVAGQGGKAAGGSSGSGGVPAKNYCEQLGHPYACGGDDTEMRSFDLTDTSWFTAGVYCLVVRTPSLIWSDESPGFCSDGTNPTWELSGSNTCKVIWGPDGPETDARLFSSRLDVLSAGDPCITQISRSLYERVPGNQFCSCP